MVLTLYVVAVKIFWSSEEDKLLNLHQTQKCCKDISKITGTGWRTFQRIIKYLKDGELSTTSRRIMVENQS